MSTPESLVERLLDAIPAWRGTNADTLFAEAADALLSKDAYIEARAAEIEALRTRCETAERDLLDVGGKWIEAKQRAEALRAARDEALAALEPFSELACEGNDDQPDDTKVTVHAGRSIDYTLRLSDLRKARDVHYRATAGDSR